MRANDCVNLLVQRGEVHCLLGENGAGKSTLMNVLAGIYQPDEGTIRVGGEEVCITCPRDAIDLGIGMVHQHSSLIPNFTVLENLMLGQGEGVRLSVKKAQEGLARLSAMLGVEVDPDTAVEQLSLGQQQQVEIIKALWQGSKVLILDEPTSMLTPKGIEDLERVLMQLKQQGLAVVFITHKLHEAFTIGDRVSVLRQGRLEGTIDRETMRPSSPERAAAHGRGPHVPRRGREPGQRRRAARPRGAGRCRAARRTVGEPLLGAAMDVDGRRQDTARSASRRRFSLTVHAGEVLGIAGVDGNGQRPLAEAIAGQRPAVGRRHQARRHVDAQAEHRRAPASRPALRHRRPARTRASSARSASPSTWSPSASAPPPFWVHGRTRPAAIDAQRRRSWWTSTTS